MGYSRRRALLLQNQISGFDGRSRISHELIQILNDLGVTPDMTTFARHRDAEAFTGAGSSTERVRILRTLYPFRSGYIPQVLLHNALVTRKLGYDLVFNLNDNFYCLPKGPAFVHIISDPLEHSIFSAKHRPWSSAVKYYGYLFDAVCKVLDSNTTGEIIANSEFTANRLIRFRASLRGRVVTINPPCVRHTDISAGARPKAFDVVSVGAFAPEKGQMEQMTIAKHNPDLRFALVGRVWNRRYFLQCVKYKDSEGLGNVTLFPNLPRPQMDELLAKARVFLHYKRDEGFGISTVEGIAKGCIPVVPDAGGQREVVLLPELRFRNDREIPEILKKVMSWSDERASACLSGLQRHIRHFSVEEFRAKMVPMLSRLI